MLSGHTGTQRKKRAGSWQTLFVPLILRLSRPPPATPRLSCSPRTAVGSPKQRLFATWQAPGHVQPVARLGLKHLVDTRLVEMKCRYYAPIIEGDTRETARAVKNFSPTPDPPLADGYYCLKPTDALRAWLSASPPAAETEQGHGNGGTAADGGTTATRRPATAARLARGNKEADVQQALVGHYWGNSLVSVALVCPDNPDAQNAARMVWRQ